jgi:hypothetical protein
MLDLSIYFNVYESVALKEEERILQHSEDIIEIGILLVVAYLCIGELEQEIGILFVIPIRHF